MARPKTTNRSSENNSVYYAGRKESRKAEIHARLHMIRQHVRDLKVKTGCCKCGYNKSSAALQYHHVTPSDKEHNVARMAAQGRSLTSIQTEIDKCILMCANCHAEEHESLLIV